MNFVGKDLGGYRVTQELGRGGMSVIYLARQSSIPRDVAIKVISNSLSAEDTFLQRFENEVRVTAQLQHPHIIPVYDHGIYDQSPYIVMAYIPGGSVEELAADGPLPLESVLPIIEQTAEALDYAHSHGVIHRDVKPANLLLDAQGNVILSDFGVARLLSSPSTLTSDGMVGTAAYYAPEMTNLDGYLTSAADIYSLGCTAFRLLTGRLPFEGASAIQLMWAHVNNPAPVASVFNTTLPHGIDEILQKAMAKSPGMRYATASDFYADLLAAAEGRYQPSQEMELTPADFPAQVLQRSQKLADAVAQIINQVIRISRPDGGSGSGLAWPGDVVLTALHVVDGAPGIYIRFLTGEEIEADVIGADPSRDLGLLRLRRTPRTVAPVALEQRDFQADPLLPGELLAAIGHPLGLDWSVTGGHYNGLREPGQEALRRFGINLTCPLVQVDVAINPGNSGGPIIDLESRLVGIADSMINPALANDIGFGIYGPAALAFLEANAANREIFIPYSDGHHHKQGLTYSPFTGRPIHPLPLIPMPDSTLVRYSDGRLRPPGLTFDPGTGKPLRQLETLPNQPPTDMPAAPCKNCGFVYALNQSHCPQCGRPRQI